MPFQVEKEPVTASRVLVALAEPTTSQKLRDVLAGQVDTVIAADTVDAVWLAIDGAPIDLAYVDLAVAGSEACELIGRLRQHARSRNLPVVVLSRRERTDLLGSSLDRGASAFLLHEIDWAILPIHFDYVLRHARKWIRDYEKREAMQARCRASDAFLGGACGESRAVMRLIGEFAAKALRSREATGNAATLVAGLRAINSQAVQLDRLIDDAVVAAKDLDRSIALAVRPSLLSLMVGDALAEITALGASRNVNVTTSLPRHDVVVACDDDAMSEALQHLLRNAVTHAPAGSKVEVEAKVHADRMLTIAVSDRGHGMSPEFVARCLTPLAADLEFGPPRQRIGRGLPFAKAIAEAHGGTLEIRTNLRAGTMAMIVIPPARVHLATAGSQPS